MRADAALFACAFVLPFLRHFYELATPTGEAAIAWAVGSVLGIAGCWAPSGCSVAHRRFTESKPRHRPAGDVTGRLSS